MRKLGLLIVVVGMLAAAPAVFASSSTGTACRSAKYGNVSLRVHGISCRAAYSGGSLAPQGFKCRQTGKQVPFKVTCTNRKHHSVFYSYVFRGG